MAASFLTIDTDDYKFNFIDVIYENNIVSINIEIYRWRQIKILKQHIKNIFIKYKVIPYKKGLDVNIENVIARVLFESFSKHKITHLQDGLFNIVPGSKSLYNDLKTTFMINNDTISNQVCNNIINEINIDNFSILTIKKIKEMTKKIMNDSSNMGKQTGMTHILEEKNNNPDMIPNFKISNKSNFSITVDNIIISISKPIYNKLKSRYTDYNNATYINCDEAIACLLLRYNSLGSDGNQMGIPIQVKDKFKKCGINFEGFASALNHYYKYYCSMFYDIEKYFGSLGPFQNIEYIRGTYLINPPYEKNLLDAMVAKMINSMDNSKEKLCFVFGTPTWSSYKEIKFHDVAMTSKYYKRHYTFGDYEVPWYNFYNDTYTKIPSSTRYIMANYYINIKCINDCITYWRALKVKIN
jgi:hypothetical protein